MTDRVVLITGGTGVLGKKVARLFADAGHSLVLLGTDAQKLDSLARDLTLPAERILTSVVNLRDEHTLRAAAEAVAAKFGRLHAVIHLVGGWLGGKTLAESSADDLTSMLDQHVWTTFHLFQIFSPLLAKSNWGRVITISPSMIANPPPKRAVYLSTKAAQETLVLSLAAELKESNVTANIIQVKAIDVDGKGIGATPDEIVAAIRYLFSEEASKVSGAKLPLG